VPGLHSSNKHRHQRGMRARVGHLQQHNVDLS